MNHHKKPFSGKAKKAQLAAKRDRIRARNTANSQLDVDDDPRLSELSLISGTKADKNNNHSSRTTTKGRYLTTKASPMSHDGSFNRLASIFSRLTAAEIAEQKKQSQKPFTRRPNTALEIGLDDLYHPSKLITFPQRPEWFPGDSKEVVEGREERIFKEWMDDLFNKWSADELSFFEQNIEVWRQLWRVVEISDIVLFAVDARHPVLHFPPTLYEYVVHKMKKKLILVFTKVRFIDVLALVVSFNLPLEIDLVDSRTLTAWRNYFQSKYPDLQTAAFSIYPREAFLATSPTTKSSYTRASIHRSLKRYIRAVGISEVFRACRNVKIQRSGDVVDWDKMIEEEEQDKKRMELDAAIKRAADESRNLDDLEKETDWRSRGRRYCNRLDREKSLEFANVISTTEDDSVPENENSSSESEDDGSVVNAGETSNMFEEQNIAENMLTIEIANRNVGKSSLINGIVGKKVVSTSRTPGHTKHFQTIHLTKTVRLCDCPGLVFPAILPKPLQILSGMYKIAQVQEPYSSIQYLAENIPIVEVLKLKPPGESSQKGTNFRSETPAAYLWSAWDICESFAIQRGMANDGRLLLSFKPPGYFSDEMNSINNDNESDDQLISQSRSTQAKNDKNGMDQDFPKNFSVSAINKFAMLSLDE
ncbi:Guanine nucleotide-binding-like protein 1 [Entophlyctis luteolus]|nr:Guanine nucleotide-binding-like protein 1 [Entophlyctis luteolus]